MNILFIFILNVWKSCLVIFLLNSDWTKNNLKACKLLQSKYIHFEISWYIPHIYVCVCVCVCVCVYVCVCVCNVYEHFFSGSYVYVVISL